MRPSVRIVVILVSLFIGVGSVVSRASAFDPSAITRNEFTEDYVSNLAARHGGDPYEDTQQLVDRYLGSGARYEPAPVSLRNPHTPIQILLSRPLSHLPYRTARVVWLVVMAALIAGALGTVVRRSGGTRTTALAVGVGALALPVAQKELLYANVNGLILALIVGAWILDNRGRPRAAGALLGLAGAIKLYPLFLVIPFLRRKRFEGVVAMITNAIIISSIGFLIPGFTLTAFRSSSTANLSFWRAAPMNFSLFGVAYRWLTTSYWRPHAPSVGGLAAIMALAGIAMAAVAAARSRASLTGDVYWSAVPWMLLASPLMWDHYLVVAIPILILIAASSIRERRLPPLWLVAVGGVLAIGQPPGLNGPAPPVSVAALLLGYGLVTYGLVALGVRDGLGEGPDVKVAAR